MRRLAGLDEHESEHWATIARDDSEPSMSRLRDDLEKHDIEAEVEPVMTGRGERYDLLVRQSDEAEAKKVLTAFHGRGLSRDRSYKLPERGSMEERSATKAKFQVGDRVSFDGKTFGTVQDVTPAGPDGYTYDTSWDDGEESREIEKFLKKAKHEDHSGRRLAGMREAVAGGFTAVSLYIDDERVQIGDPDYIKMTDDIEGAVEDLKQKYRGAKVTVTPAGEREVMIEVERKARGESLGERAVERDSDKEWQTKMGMGVRYRDLRQGQKFRFPDSDAVLTKLSGKLYQDPEGRKFGTGAGTGVMVVREEESRSLGERSAPTGEDLAHEIESEIGRWLEDEEEFELGDINRAIESGGSGERAVLADNIHSIVERELNKRLGSGAAKGISIEIDPRGFESSPGEEDDGGYRAGGDFRIWHDKDSYAQGSFAAKGMSDELQDMTINITQASGHQKKNGPLRFFG